MWTHFSRWIVGRANGLVTRRRMSRLTARIMAIMLFPLAIFLVGLLSLDQYRTTLIQSEFVALERQGFTLARSLAPACFGLARARLARSLLPASGGSPEARLVTRAPASPYIVEHTAAWFDQNAQLRTQVPKRRRLRLALS